MNRDLRLLSASLFLWGIGEGMFLYLQPIYLTQLGANAVQVGGILGLGGAAPGIAPTSAGGPWSVGRALTTISAMYNAGAIIGPFFGGLLAAAAGLRNVYGFAAGLFVVSAILISMLSQQPVGPPRHGS